MLELVDERDHPDAGRLSLTERLKIPLFGHATNLRFRLKIGFAFHFDYVLIL